jgi:ligand-binding sensor domain-containing protein
VDGHRAVAVADDYSVANFIAFEHGIHWVGTDSGLYCVTDDETFRVSGLEASVDALHSLGGRLWVRSQKAVFRIDGRDARAFRLHDPDLDVARLEEIAGGLWLFTARLIWSGNVGRSQPGPVYQIDGDEIREGPTDSIPISAVTSISDDLWFVATRGPAYRLRSHALKPFPRKKAIVHAVSSAGGDVWLRAEDGAYRVRGERSRRIPNMPLVIQDIQDLEGHAVVITADQAFQVDGESVIEIPRPPV